MSGSPPEPTEPTWFTRDINNPVVPGDVIAGEWLGPNQNWCWHIGCGGPEEKVVTEVRWEYDKYVYYFLDVNEIGEEITGSIDAVHTRKVGVATTAFLLTHSWKQLRDIGLERIKNDSLRA